MIVENQQKRDENIENFIRKSICGYDGDDPKVCCATTVAMSSSPAAIILSTSTQSQPGPFIFSAVSPQQNPSTNPPLNTGSQPTFSPLQPSAGNSGNPTISTSPGTFIFGPIGSSSNVPSQPTSPIPTNPVLTNRLPSYDADKCGVSYAVRSRIVGGTNAPRGAYPWLAALGYRTPSLRFLCGGTLITQKHVVSAAHCVIDGLTLVRLGAYDITSNSEGSIDVNIESKVVHESYDPKFIANDISMLKLAQIVNVSNLIKPICIPMTDALINRDYTGSTPYVAGWGSTSFRGPGSAILQEVQLPVIATSDCEFNYRLYFPNQVFDNRVLCAGYAQGGKDSCQGDSGGGLVLPILAPDGASYYYILIGIVSYGFECARPNFPGIYTRVPSFLAWIQKRISE